MNMARTTGDTKWLVIATVLTLPLSFISIIGSLMVIIPHSTLLDKVGNATYRRPSEPLRCLSEREIPFLLYVDVNSFLDSPRICLQLNDTTSIYFFETLTRSTHGVETQPYMTELRMKSGESLRLKTDTNRLYVNFSMYNSNDELTRESLIKMPETSNSRHLEEVSETGILFRNSGRSPAGMSPPALGLANAALFGNGGGFGGFGGDAIRNGFRSALLGSGVQSMPQYNPYAMPATPPQTPYPSYPSYPTFPTFPPQPNAPQYPMYPNNPYLPPYSGDKSMENMPTFPYLPYQFPSAKQQPLLTQYSHQFTVPGSDGKPITQQHYYSNLMNPTHQNIPKTPQEFGYDPEKVQEDFNQQLQDILGGMGDTTNPWASYDMGEGPSASNTDVV